MSTANERCIQTAYASDGTTSSDVERWYVDVPAVDYVRQAFVGALANLGFSTSYNPINEQAAEYGSLIIESLTQIVPPEIVTVPANSEITLAPINYDAIAGNPMIWVVNTNQRSAGFFQQNPAIAAAAFLFNRYMAAGDWSYRITYLRNTNCGILQLTIGHFGGGPIYQTNHDLRGAVQNNTYATGTFSLPQTASQKFSISCDTNGTSGAGFTIPISHIELWRTDDP
jgi:hypothetical protein